MVVKRGIVAKDNRAAFVRAGRPAGRGGVAPGAGGRAAGAAVDESPPDPARDRLGDRHADHRHRRAGPHRRACATRMRGWPPRSPRCVGRSRRARRRCRRRSTAAGRHRASAEPPPRAVAASACRRPSSRADAATAGRRSVPAIRRAPPQVGWEQRLGARAFIWIGADHARARGDLPGALLDRGGLSLARSAGDPGGAVRLRADRRRREGASRATTAWRRRWPPPASPRSTARCSRRSRSTA